MRTGLLGGTFNPVHLGHLVLAQESWFQLELDRVLFVPAYIPPHKDLDLHVPASDRLNMVRLALEGDDRFEICTYELDRGEVSYSIDTVRHMKRSEPDNELFFITGADSGRTLHEWREVDQLLDLVNFVIASRPGYGQKSVHEDRIQRINIPRFDISSTMIRQRIAERGPVDYLMPERVVSYIRRKALYRKAS